MLKYISFYGKAPRTEYWCVGLISFVLLFPAPFTLGIVLLSLLLENNELESIHYAVDIVKYVTAVLSLLAVFLFLSTSVRRCRDAGKNPWWMLLLIVPFVNIVLLILLGFLKSSTPRTNM